MYFTVQCKDEQDRGTTPCLKDVHPTLRIKARDFPGGPVVKNPPSNAGDVGSIPGGGTKIPHAVEQLNPCATTTEPTCSGALTPQL